MTRGEPCELTENTHEITDHGAHVMMYLAESDDGWRWGYGVRMQQAGAGCYPFTCDKPEPTRDAAVDRVIDNVMRFAGGPSLHNESATELAQRKELVAWCQQQKQMELFA